MPGCALLAKRVNAVLEPVDLLVEIPDLKTHRSQVALDDPRTRGPSSPRRPRTAGPTPRARRERWGPQTRGRSYQIMRTVKAATIVRHSKRRTRTSQRRLESRQHLGTTKEEHHAAFGVPAWAAFHHRPLGAVTEPVHLPHTFLRPQTVKQPAPLEGLRFVCVDSDRMARRAAVDLPAPAVPPPAAGGRLGESVHPQRGQPFSTRSLVCSGHAAIKDWAVRSRAASAVPLAAAATADGDVGYGAAVPATCRRSGSSWLRGSPGTLATLL